MGAVHTARFKKFAYLTDGEQNMAHWQKFIKCLKRKSTIVQYFRISSDPDKNKYADFLGGILAMHEIPSRLEKTNNARRRQGLKTRRKNNFLDRTINANNYE